MHARTISKSCWRVYHATKVSNGTGPLLTLSYPIDGRFIRKELYYNISIGKKLNYNFIYSKMLTP